MCGRAYSTFSDEELALRYLNRKPPAGLPKLAPNYNLAPTQLAPIVRVGEDGEREIARLRFGLVPAWARSVQDAAKYSLINAKGEEIETKPSYRHAFARRRCLVPVSGFYEWKRVEGEKTKRPFAIHGAREPILSLAGVWERWESRDTGEIVESFAIVTTEPNAFMRGIHDRMPVILAPEDEAAWLDPARSRPTELKPLLRPCADDRLAAHEVSTLVNSPRNNGPELLEPAKAG